MWPNSELTKYLSLSGSAVKSYDLNAIQDKLINLQSIPLSIFDEFIDLIAAPLGSGDDRYTATTGAGGQIDIRDDATNGAFGALFLDSAAVACTVYSVFGCGIIQGDFRMMHRARATASIGANASRVTFFGVATGTATNSFGFRIAGTGNWSPVVNGVVGTPTTAVSSLGAYQTFEMNRVFGTINFLVDGVLIYTTADSTDLSDKFFLWSTLHGTEVTDWYGY